MPRKPTFEEYRVRAFFSFLKNAPEHPDNALLVKLWAQLVEESVGRVNAPSECHLAPDASMLWMPHPSLLGAPCRADGESGDTECLAGEKPPYKPVQVACRGSEVRVYYGEEMIWLWRETSTQQWQCVGRNKLRERLVYIGRSTEEEWDGA